MTQKPYRTSRTVVGIAEKDSVDRFVRGLRLEFSSIKVKDSGQYVVAHERIVMEDGNKIDVIVYSSHNIAVSASPKIASECFGQIEDRIIKIAETSQKTLAKERPITMMRAQWLLDYCKDLQASDENERMVIVILSDTCNEIVITEKLMANRMDVEVLKRDMPTKIRLLKDKEGLAHEENNILSTRDLRNDVVHKGLIPTKGQAEEALKTASSVLQYYCT